MSENQKLFRQQAVDAQNVMNGRTRIAPPPSWMATNILLISLVTGMVIFAIFATYARTINVTGQIDSSTGTPQIIADQNGRLEMHVQQGTAVTKGDKIATLSTGTDNGQGNLQEQRKQQSQAEADAANARAAAVTQAGAMEAQAHMARVQSGQDRIADLRDQLTEARIQTAKAKADLDRASAIAERGFLSRRDLDERERVVSTRREAESRINEQIGQARGDIAMAQANARQATSQADADAQLARGDATRAMRSSIDEQAVTSIEYNAPLSGTVAAAPYRTGTRVSQGSVIAIMTSPKAKNIARLSIPAASMSGVAEGQEIKIAVDAYPYQTFGTITSKVIKVSTAARQTEDGPVFDIEAAMPATIKAYSKKVELLPGMTVTARIQTEERSFMEWLLAPLYAVGKR